jgi:hypothetical protein
LKAGNAATASVPVLTRSNVITTCVVDFFNQNYCTKIDVNADVLFDFTLVM